MQKNTCIIKQKKGLPAKDKCVSCNKQGKVFLAYGPQNFCEKHFIELIERRVKKTIRENNLIKKREHIVVGVSGGKDSLTCLYILKKYFGKTNKITALMVDEGIPGYRDKAIQAGIKSCEKWNVNYVVTSYQKEFGATMKKIQKKRIELHQNSSPCSYCGVLRRKTLNRYALKLKADKLATGHNLDDEAQSILMNVFDNNLFGFKRIGVVSGTQKIKGFVPRIKPLYDIPENEVLLYASFLGIEHYSHECCPFSGPAKRNKFRAMIDSFELSYPGTKHSIISFFKKIKKELKKEMSKELSFCEKCGEPCKKNVCNACKKLEEIKE